MSTVYEAAGFFLYRLNDAGEAEFLLLRNAKLGHWGTPKGHRDEEDQDLFACAERELREETGLWEVMVHSGFRQEIQYSAKRHGKGDAYDKSVTYFLARLENGDVQHSEEHNSMGWYGRSKAKSLLKFENLVAILDKTCEYLETVCKVRCGKDLE